jgi:flavin reductase (DIM6/NTAB) family NADH-FMN oxidoreductase RutF
MTLDMIVGRNSWTSRKLQHVELIFGPTMASFDTRRARDIMGNFPTGVIVVTTIGEDGRPVGLTINSFSSVSLEPPMVLWSLALRAPSLVAFRASNVFALNILSKDQLDLCKSFAKPSTDKYACVEYCQGGAGLPLLSGAVAHIECRTVARYPGGDHEIYLGEVAAMDGFERDPLLFHRGQFRMLSPLEDSANQKNTVRSQLTSDSSKIRHQ